MTGANMQGRKVIFLVVSEASFEVRNNILAKIKANLDIHGAARIDRVKQNLNIPSWIKSSSRSTETRENYDDDDDDVCVCVCVCVSAVAQFEFFSSILCLAHSYFFVMYKHHRPKTKEISEQCKYHMIKALSWHSHEDLNVIKTYAPLSEHSHNFKFDS